MIWYFARSAGIVAYLLLSSSVLIGVLMSGERFAALAAGTASAVSVAAFSRFSRRPQRA